MKVLFSHNISKHFFYTYVTYLKCVHTLSQMFPTMFKPREICGFIQGHVPLHWVRSVTHVSGVITTPLTPVICGNARQSSSRDLSISYFNIDLAYYVL